MLQHVGAFVVIGSSVDRGLQDYLGEGAEIVRVDHLDQELPYLVEFDNGVRLWVAEDELEDDSE
jgi:hypothetical protein